MFGALVEFAIICTVNRNREKTQSSSSKAGSMRVSSTIHLGSFNFISVGVSGEPADRPEVTINLCWNFSFLLSSRY